MAAERLQHAGFFGALSRRGSRARSSVGGILAVAGCVYQTLFRNALASPYTLGTASGATLGACLATALPAAWCVSLALALLARPLDALLAGDDAAVSHGIDPARLRFALLGVSALLVACAVAVCGPVGFVGPLVPHLARLTAGAAHRRLVPACAVGGGLFLALCDAVARALPFAGTPPVGVVTAAIGAPALAILLARKGRA